MEKINRTGPPGKVDWIDLLLNKQDEIIDHLTLLDKLAIRVARLEVYYKAHRKEHRK